VSVDYDSIVNFHIAKLKNIAFNVSLLKSLRRGVDSNHNAAITSRFMTMRSTSRCRFQIARQ
jgi:hypothetical protein